MKKFIKGSLLLFFFFLSIYFVFCVCTNYSYDEVLPPYVQTFVVIRDPKKVLGTNKEIVEKFVPTTEKLISFLPFIPNLQVVIAKLAEGPILIIDTSYYRGIVSLVFMLKKQVLFDTKDLCLEENFLLSKKDKDAFIIKKGRETLGFLTKKRNLIVISPSLKAILAVNANLKMKTKEGIKVEPEGDIFSFFIPHDLLKSFVSLYPQLRFILPVLRRVNYGTLTFYFRKNYIESKFKILLKQPKTYRERVYARLLSIEVEDVDFSELVPARTETFVSFSVESFWNLYKYLVIILKDYPSLFEEFSSGRRIAERLSDRDIKELFFSWLGNTVITLSLSGETLFLVQVKDKKLFLHSFSNFIGERKRLENIDVFKIELPGIIGILKSIFAPSIHLPLFSFYKDYVVIADNPQSLLKIMTMNTIDITSTREYEIYEDKVEKGQIQFFIDVAYGNFPFINVSPILKEILRRYQKFYGSVKLKYPRIEVNSVFVR